jgi:peptidoglycan lytic transglycosylase G
VSVSAECGRRNAKWKRGPRFRLPPSALRVVAVGALACSAPAPKPCNVNSSVCVLFTIPRGASLRAAADTLEARGLITHRGWFTVYARWRGLGAALKSGDYALPLGSGWSEIVSTLRLGRGALVRFTVPEGLWLSEVADYARQDLGVPRDSFLAAARDPALLDSLGIAGAAETAEGFLYPSTYSVRPHVTGRELVRIMTGAFRSRWPDTWTARLDTLGMTRLQVVTLASIIQAEVRYAPDRPYVSAVYHNRLREGMLLQADPTVVYAMGRRLHRVYEKYLLKASPYNTYLHAGLPPGPIGEPDSASLAAALYPASVPFLYFVAQPDGKHIFSVTYRDHLAAIRRVQQLQRGDPADR